jgi:phi13 family phage major tail protein
MAAGTNKKHYDVATFYYAVGTKDATTGVITYTTPVKEPGVESLAAKAQGNTSTTRADGINYLVNVTNNGYELTVKEVMLSDAFKVAALGETKDTTTGLQYEDADIDMPIIACLFEFKGDNHHTRHVFYNCTCSRPDVNGENKDNAQEPDDDEITITASPQPMVMDAAGTVKNITKAFANDGDTSYTNWYTKVQTPEYVKA